jgi:nucleoside-diphosphate-sugar epimerase
VSKPKVVITGAAGFIGSRLAWRLHKEEYPLILIDDLSYGYETNLVVDDKNFASLIKKDIRSPDMAEYFEDADTVFHLAAISALPVNQSEPAKAISINVEGVTNVLEAARVAGVRRVVFASTSAIYENNTKFPCAESDPVSPRLIYSLSKWQGEKLCESYRILYGMEIAVTRYYNVYGPHQDIHRKSPPFVGYVIRELLKGCSPVLHSNGEQKRDYVFLEDVNALNIACMNHPNAAMETFNVASGAAYSVNEIYEIIAETIGTKIRPEFRSASRFWEKYPSLYEGKRPLSPHILEKEVDKFTLGDTKKASSVLGWTSSVSIRDGLRETIDYTRHALGIG